MDKRIEWPWSLEEEAEWKTDLAQRDQDELEELSGDALEDAPATVEDIPEEISTGDSLPEKYSVTA